MSAAEMPEGVALRRRHIAGRRVVIKDRRYYGNRRGLKAQWPEAGLGEWEQYKMMCVLAGRINTHLGNSGSGFAHHAHCAAGI